MKKRNSFVSNSSSSSFILIGIMESECKREWDEIEEAAQKAGIDLVYNEPECFIGNIIAEGEDGYLEDGSISPLEFLEKASEIQEFLNSQDIDSSNIKLYYGIRPS